MLAALKVFRQVGETVDTDYLALEVLPILWSFSLGPLLNLQQFGEFMALIKSLSGKIEREQTKKLQELSSGDSGGFQNGAGSSFNVAADHSQSSVDGTRDTFERLVLGKGSTGANNQEMDMWAEPPATQASRHGPSAEFSWSSTATPTGNAGNVNRGQSPMQNAPGFRTVTPDYNLSSFPSLQPASQKSPTAPAFPTLQPASPGGGHNLQGSMSGSSLASLSSMSTSNTAFSNPPPQQAPNYSAFSIPPPPATSSPLGSYTTASAGPSVSRPSLGANMTSPPMQNNPPQPRQGQGLDKYESLL